MEKKTLNMVKVACTYFDNHMNKKRFLLEEDLEHCKDEAYNKFDYNWMREFDKIMKRKRNWFE